MNKAFNKITAITGGAASVTSPEFSLATNSEVVFLVGASETPLTVKVKGFAGDTEKDVVFNGKSLTDAAWTEVSSDGLSLENTGAFLVSVAADKYGHDGIDRVALYLAGEAETPETIYAFEVARRFEPSNNE